MDELKQNLQFLLEKSTSPLLRKLIEELIDDNNQDIETVLIKLCDVEFSLTGENE